MFHQSICLAICILTSLATRSISSDETEAKTVFVAIFSIGDHVLIPYFLSYLGALNFPKDKMSLYIRTASSSKADQMLNTWTAVNKPKYKSIDLSPVTSEKHIDDYYDKALKEAREMDADYLWYLNKQTFLTDQNVLHYLIGKQKGIMAPMLTSTEYYFSNFWGDMDEDYGYRRSYDYVDIIEREKKGCFKVPVLTHGFLIDLREAKTKDLSFHFGNAPFFGALYERAKMLEIDSWICNEREFGWIIPDFKGNGQDDFVHLREFKETMYLRRKFPTIPRELQKYHAQPTEKLGMDKIYVINLVRRPFRKKVMKDRLNDIGLDATFFEAIDSRKLNSSYLDSIGFKVIEDYDDIYMTHGSIATGLSHYSVWEDIIRNNYQKAMIFEDDVIPDNNFKERFSAMLKETEELKLEWELIYLGRTPEFPWKETQVENSTHLINPSGTWGAFGYVLSLEGAKKLYSPTYVSNMVPADDYILLKFVNQDELETRQWKLPFCPCDLKAFSIHPLIIYHKYFRRKGTLESDTLSSKQHYEPYNTDLCLAPEIWTEDPDYCIWN